MQVCCVAGFQTRFQQWSGAGLEAGGTAGLETCATQPRQVRAKQIRSSALPETDRRFSSRGAITKLAKRRDLWQTSRINGGNRRQFENDNRRGV